MSRSRSSIWGPAGETRPIDRALRDLGRQPKQRGGDCGQPRGAISRIAPAADDRVAELEPGERQRRGHPARDQRETCRLRRRGRRPRPVAEHDRRRRACRRCRAHPDQRRPGTELRRAAPRSRHAMPAPRSRVAARDHAALARPAANRQGPTRSRQPAVQAFRHGRRHPPRSAPISRNAIRRGRAGRAAVEQPADRDRPPGPPFSAARGSTRGAGGSGDGVEPHAVSRITSQCGTDSPGCRSALSNRIDPPPRGRQRSREPAGAPPIESVEEIPAPSIPVDQDDRQHDHRAPRCRRRRLAPPAGRRGEAERRATSAGEVDESPSRAGG
jgi:hypothetical protein